MRVTKTVKDRKYLTHRNFVSGKQYDTSCGREGTFPAESKYAMLEQQAIRAKITEQKTILHDMTQEYIKTQTDTALEPDKIVHGDALKAMHKMPSDSVHMAITSPPYNVGLKYTQHADNMTYNEYLDWLETVFRELYRILVDGGRFALNIAPTGIADFTPTHHDVTSRLLDMGFKLRTEILWYKQNIRKRTAWGSWRSPSNPHIMPSWEYVYVFSKGDMRLKGDPGQVDITDKEFKLFSDGFWHIQPETKRNGHPAPFPEELIYRLIKYYTYRDNVVLDMFGGTGTTALVSRKTGRQFIHIDTSKEYCKVAQTRISSLYVSGKSQTLEKFAKDGLLPEIIQA